jgi:hypothetical protein
VTCSVVSVCVESGNCTAITRRLTAPSRIMSDMPGGAAPYAETGAKSSCSEAPVAAVTFQNVKQATIVSAMSILRM